MIPIDQQKGLAHTELKKPCSICKKSDDQRFFHEELQKKDQYYTTIYIYSKKNKFPKGLACGYKRINIV